MADVFQCPIYLDPWEKEQLEGVALMVQRIPDTEERTHHGVTCQRWHVRFEEDQDLAVRWLDVADKYLWEPVIRNTSLIQWNIPEANFTDEIAKVPFRIGPVELYWTAGNPLAAFVAPAAGRIRCFSLHSFVSAYNADGDRPTFQLLLNSVFLIGYYPTNGAHVGVHDYEVTPDYKDKIFAKGDRITAHILCILEEGETVTLTNSLMFPLIQWGTFP